MASEAFEAAKRRVASAESWAKSAAQVLESTAQAFESAKCQVAASQKELNASKSDLKVLERKFEVIAIDCDGGSAGLANHKGGYITSSYPFKAGSNHLGDKRSWKDVPNKRKVSSSSSSSSSSDSSATGILAAVAKKGPRKKARLSKFACRSFDSSKGILGSSFSSSSSDERIKKKPKSSKSRAKKGVHLLMSNKPLLRSFGSSSDGSSSSNSSDEDDKKKPKAAKSLISTKKGLSLLIKPVTVNIKKRKSAKWRKRAP